MKRSAGILAMVLGAVGIVLSVLAALWMGRLVTGAADFVDDATLAVDAALERVEDRIVFAGSAPTPAVIQDRLGAARDGFASAAAAAKALDTHPLISLLPVDVEGLSIAAAAVFVDDAREDPETVLAEAAANLAAAREELDDFTGSLRTWVRIAAALLFLTGVWSVWAQYHLARWGWRAWRTNPPDA